MGVWVGVADNQTARAGDILRELSLPADMIATSDNWNVAKPDPAFRPADAPNGPRVRDRPGRLADRTPSPGRAPRTR